MEEQTVTRSIPGSVGLLGVLVIAALAAVGIWSFVDSYLIGSADVLASTLGALAVVVVTVAALSVLGARSKQWLSGPYW